MRKSPWFTLATLATLAIGIGATTAIFTLMHAVLFKALPVKEPSQLYRIGSTDECCFEGWETNPQHDWSLFSYALYRRLKDASPEFQELAAFSAIPQRMSVRRSGVESTAKSLRGEFVSGNYFQMFGLNAAAGRAITPGDDRASAAPVAVLSYHTWQQNYGSDRSIVGSVFTVEGRPLTIVGIAPAGFYGDTLRADPADFWVPLQQEPLLYGKNQHLRDPNSHWLYAIGRVRPGANLGPLPGRLTAVLHQYLKTEVNLPPEMLAQRDYDLPRKHITLSPARGGVQTMSNNYGQSLRLLLSICASVLLIACANVANLLLARAQVRRAEFSLRVALGAKRKRLVSQALTEAVLTSLLGGALGVYLAYAGASLILTLTFGRDSFIPIDPSPSWPVLGFAFVLSLLTGVLFGTVPAWFASGSDPAEALRGANRSTRSKTSSPQKILVIGQAALSLVLLAGAGLLTRSLERLQYQDFGIRTDRVISVEFHPPSPDYNRDQLGSLYRNIEDGVSKIPGVRSVSLALYSPLSGNNWGETVVVDGRPSPKSIEKFVSWDRVSSRFLETVGQQVLRGRGFEDHDTASTRGVAVVNERFVRDYFPHEDPIGKHFGLDATRYATTFEIVGVVRDAKYVDPNQPARPMFLVPLKQWATYKEPQMSQFEAASHLASSLQIHLRDDGHSIESQVRNALASVDPNLTVVSYRTMQEQVADNFGRERMVAQLSGSLAVIALLLAAIGLYGVTSYAVAVRTGEIGVRIALGASPKDIWREVLKGAFAQVAVGLVLGLPLAYAACRLISSQVYDVSSFDPVTLGVAIMALCLCAFVASIIPAQRAAGVDPVRAMRTE